MSGSKLEFFLFLFELYKRALCHVPLKGIWFCAKCLPPHMRARKSETLAINTAHCNDFWPPFL